jgi:hypothetical protein
MVESQITADNSTSLRYYHLGGISIANLTTPRELIPPGGINMVESPKLYQGVVRMPIGTSDDIPSRIEGLRLCDVLFSCQLGKRVHFSKNEMFAGLQLPKGH